MDAAWQFSTTTSSKAACTYANAQINNVALRILLESQPPAAFLRMAREVLTLFRFSPGKRATCLARDLAHLADIPRTHALFTQASLRCVRDVSPTTWFKMDITARDILVFRILMYWRQYGDLWRDIWSVFECRLPTWRRVKIENCQEPLARVIAYHLNKIPA